MLDRSTYPYKRSIEIGLYTLYLYSYTIELCYKTRSLFENFLLTCANRNFLHFTGDGAPGR
jgi:hypothetical protein